MRKFMLITNRYKDRDLTLSNEIVSYIQQKGGSAAICVSNVEDAGVILPTSVKTFSIILLRQAYLGIPKELIEAAKIDGAGELRTWATIMIPGIMPSISTIIIFDFIGNWNAFLWPIIVLQDPEKYPLATALQYLNGSFSYKFGYVAAGTVISIIPVLLVFMMCQKNYIEAVSGAVKG